MAEKVSILICSHRRPKTFRRLLDSIVAQQDFDDYKVYVCDDSEDLSEAVEDVVEDFFYGPLEGKLTVHFQDGKIPPLTAWNHLVEKAKGEYIKFCFDDDWLDWYCLHDMAKVLDENPDVSLVYSSARWRHPHMHDVELFKYNVKQPLKIPSKEFVSGRLSDETWFNYVDSPMLTLVRNKGIKFVQTYSYPLLHEGAAKYGCPSDEEWVQDNALAGENVAYIPRPLVNIGDEPDSITGTKTDKIMAIRSAYRGFKKGIKYV